MTRSMADPLYRRTARFQIALRDREINEICAELEREKSSLVLAWLYYAEYAALFHVR